MFTQLKEFSRTPKNIKLFKKKETRVFSKKKKKEKN